MQRVILLLSFLIFILGHNNAQSNPGTDQEEMQKAIDKMMLDLSKTMDTLDFEKIFEESFKNWPGVDSNFMKQFQGQDMQDMFYGFSFDEMDTTSLNLLFEQSFKMLESMDEEQWNQLFKSFDFSEMQDMMEGLDIEAIEDMIRAFDLKIPENYLDSLKNTQPTDPENSRKLKRI